MVRFSGIFWTKKVIHYPNSEIKENCLIEKFGPVKSFPAYKVFSYKDNITPPKDYADRQTLISTIVKLRQH
jgi:hypothetical protein